MKRLSFLLPGLCGLMFSAPAASAADPAPAPPADQLRFFENRVRPVLVENCYRCHSESEGQAKGGLTLDTRQGWEKGGERGPALTPGHPEESLLIKAVRGADPDLTMPPKGGKLSAAQIADLESWVAMGAPDPRTAPAAPAPAAGGPMTESMKAKAASHWSFQPLGTPEVPQVRDTAWPAGDLDRFILSGLESKNLSPSPPADRRTLIRRASLDLTGLPPTPEEVRGFISDESPQAFEKVVDRLLASPHYGERWGRFWLDVARYADTRGRMRGLQTPLNPNAWTYRDYVIGAFNQDKPFDRFIMEQIAADLLPGAAEDPASLAALGFLTQGDQFGGSRPDIINDQIDVVTKGFLGLTVSCARCHDHKSDPVPQADYYSLYGVFNSCHEPDEKPVAVPAQPEDGTDAWAAARDKLLQLGRGRLVERMDHNASVLNANARFFLPLAGTRQMPPEFYTYILEHKIDSRLALPLVQSLTRALKPGPGRKPGPVLDPLKRLLHIPPEDFDARFPQWLDEVRHGRPRMPVNPAVRAAFADRQPQTRDEALDVYASVFTEADAAWHREREEWRKSGGQGNFPGLADRNLEAVRTAVVNPAVFKTGSIEAAVIGLPRTVAELAGGITSEIARLDVSHAGAPGLANVLYDNPRPRDSPVFIRGQIQTPGPVAPRRFLEFLSGPDRQPFTQGSGRLELAQAIASPANPLTARVLVNRVWQHHFGEGFVSTPDDLGVMSDAPENAALLNWLAADFMRGGWSVKRLHRAILLSSAWRQSSAPDAVKAAADPFNRLLWRQNVRRLDFESLRDSILFMGGRLDLTTGGHPVNIDSEPYSPRRSVYGFIDRTDMAEFMRSFDVANPELPTGRRFTSIVPQQALFRMNSLLVIEQARNIMARPDMKACATDAERVVKLYEIIYQRDPHEAEMRLAMDYVQRLTPPGGPRKASPQEAARAAREERRRQRLEERAMAARRNGASQIREAVRDPAAAQVDRSPLTPWEQYAHALLITNEMAYVN